MREGAGRGAASLRQDGELARPACEAGRVFVVAGVADMAGASSSSGAGRRPSPPPFVSRFRRFRVTRTRGAWQVAWFPLVAGLALLFSAGAAPALADTTPPTPSGNVALLSGTTLNQVFDEYLDVNSVPDKSAFRITADGVNVAVISVAVVRRYQTGILLLTVSSLILHRAFRFTVTYIPPDENPLQDEAGNAVAAYSVTYGTPGPPPPPPGGGGGGFGGGGGGGGARAPASPRNLTAEAGDGEVVLTWDAPEDDGGSAITDYEYRNVGRDPWTSTGSTDTAYSVRGLDNGVTYTFEVRAVNRSGKSFPSKRVEATPEAPQVFTLDFPHFANGGGITSEVVLVNVGTTPILPVLYFSDRQGKPIAATTVVDVTDDLEVTTDGGLTIQAMIEPLGELTVATHGLGEEVSGSVRVLAEGAPLGGGAALQRPGSGGYRSGDRRDGAGRAVPGAQEAGRHPHGGGAAQPGRGSDRFDVPLDERGRGAGGGEDPPRSQRTGVLVSRRRVHDERHDGLRGDGALHGAGGREVHGIGGGGGCRQPHLHDAAGGSGRAAGRRRRRDGAVLCAFRQWRQPRRGGHPLRAGVRECADRGKPTPPQRPFTGTSRRAVR